MHLTDGVTIQFKYCRPVVGHEDENVIDLEGCLREGDWNGTLDHLDRMVSEGEAESAAVADAPMNNIYRAHPELVLRLRGQIFFDMLQAGDAGGAELYYVSFIQELYPDGTTTGSPFADKMLMKTIRQMARTWQPPG